MFGLLVLGLAVFLGRPSSTASAQEQAPTEQPAVQDAEQPAGQDAAQDAAPKVRRMGRAIKLSLPITSNTHRRVKRFVDRVLTEAQQEQVRPVLIFELDVLPGQNEFGRNSQYEDALKLARFLSGESLNAATTVAYIPRSIQGHAVLVVLACDEIIMAPDAKIGSAGIDEKRIEDFIRSGYRDIAARRRTVPIELALGMLDSSRKVFVVQTEVSREFVTPEGLKKLRQQRTIKSQEVLIPEGEAGEFTGSEARRLGFVSFLAENRREVAGALELPPEDVQEDVSSGGRWVAVRIDLKGPIDAEAVNQTQRMIEDSIRNRGVNFVCLWIDSPGGSPVDSIRLANFLAFDLASERIRTVAYIPVQARSDAALVALACDEIVMYPEAVLGGWGTYDFSKEEIDRTRQIIREKLASEKSRSWSLPAAMIDPELEVFSFTRRDLGVVEYFSDEERDEQRKPKDWAKGRQVTTPRAPFQTNGTAAVDYRLANHTVESFSAFKAIYGLEDDPALVEPGWADFLIEALASPGVAWLLLMIGGAALYAELHMPGLGLGGFVATVCFLLFFWANFLGGTAGWLEAMLFVAGLVCLALEVFVLPGFGIFGLGGGLMIVASLILASQTFILPRNEYQYDQLQNSLLVIGGAGTGVIVLAMLMNRWLPRAPVLRNMMLDPPSDEEQLKLSRSEALVDFQGLVGQQGTTTTQLTPGGKARFGNQLLDVIADSELIERGTRVVVAEVQGNRVMVEAVGGRQ